MERGACEQLALWHYFDVRAQFVGLSWRVRLGRRGRVCVRHVVLDWLAVVAVWIIGHLVQLKVLLEVLQACLDLGRILVGEQRLSSIEIGGVQVASLGEL